MISEGSTMIEMSTPEREASSHPLHHLQSALTLTIAKLVMTGSGGTP